MSSHHRLFKQAFHSFKKGIPLSPGLVNALDRGISKAKHFSEPTFLLAYAGTRFSHSDVLEFIRKYGRRVIVYGIRNHIEQGDRK